MEPWTQRQEVMSLFELSTKIGNVLQSYVKCVNQGAKEVLVDIFCNFD